MSDQAYPAPVGVGTSQVAAPDLEVTVPDREIAVTDRDEPALRPPFDRAWPWLVATASLVLAATTWYSRVLSVDSYYNLFAGRLIAAHGLPHHNVFTVASRGAPWTDQQWLAHLAYYGAWALAGYPAVAALSALLVTAGFVILAVAMLRRGVTPPQSFIWASGAFVVCLASYQIDAQSFAYPLFALTVWLLVDDWAARQPHRRTWLVVPVLVGWANLHGSVVLGAGLAVSYAAWRTVTALHRRERIPALSYVGLGLASAAAVTCTPYGVGVLSYYRHLIGNPVLSRFIGQWASPNPQQPATWVFLALVLAVAGVVATSLLRQVPPDPVLASFTALILGLAVVAERNVVWFALAASLLAADTLPRARRSTAPGLGRGFTMAIAGMLAAAALTSVAVLAATPDSQFVSQVPGRAAAVAAAFAEQHPGQRILGDAYTGTSLLWLRPDLAGRIGFDVRLEQYTRPQLTEYFDYLFVRGPAWQRVTGGYQILVVSKEDGPLARAVASLPGWRVVYSGSDGIVCVRS